MELSPLAPGWKAVRLGDPSISSMMSGGTPNRAISAYFGGDIRWVKSGELDDGWIFDTEEKITLEGLQNSSARPFPPETLVVAMYGATVGKTAILGVEATTNQAICAIIPKKDSFDSQFMQFCLMHLRPVLLRARAGGAQPNINKQIISALVVPLPPLGEQRAIARALRAVQQAKEARRREATLERERKAALMEHLFAHGTRGEATKQTEIGKMPESWDVYPLGSFAEVAYGLTVNESRRKSPDLAPYLAVANVTRGAIKLDNVKEIGMLEGDAERYRLQKGDVLLVEGNGNPKLLGSAAIWKAELPFMLHQNHLIRARLDKSQAIPEWVMCYLNSDDGRSQLFGKAKTSSGLHSINSRLIAGLQIPLPPLDGQKEATDMLLACDAKIAVLERESALLDELFRALLEELMTGRLRVKDLAVLAEVATVEKKTPASQELFSKLE